MTIEQRVTALEKEVADLKRQLEGQPKEHRQVESKKVWHVKHNLGRTPIIAVIDDNNNLILPDVRYKSKNEITLSFVRPMSGTVVIV